MEIYPLTGWQNYLMGLEESPEPNRALVGLMTLSSALWIKPGLDARRLNRAFGALCKRHDVACTQFHKLGGTWKCVINAAHAIGVSVHDHHDTPENEIEGVAQSYAYKVIPMDNPALVRLDLLRFGAHGDVVVFRAHHAVTDGFGQMILTEDLIKLLLGLPLERPALSYSDYFRRFGNDSAPVSIEVEAYWERKLLPPPKPIEIGRVKRGLTLLSGDTGWQRSKTMTFELTKEQAQSLERVAQPEAVSPFLLLNTAFLEAVAEIGSTDDLLYSVTLGRSDGVLSQYAGHHTLHPLLRYHTQTNGSLVDGARATAEQLAQSIQNLPASAGRRAGAWDQRVLDAGGYPRQITTGVLSAAARVNASPFANLFLLGKDQTLNVGGKTLKGIAMPVPPGGLDELNFRPNLTPDDGVIQFKYDVEAFSDTEIDALAEGTFSRLGLQCEGRHILAD